MRHRGRLRMLLAMLVLGGVLVFGSVWIWQVSQRSTTLIVTSSPTGAAVFIDGVRQGQTPLRLNMHLGEYELLLRHDRCVLWTRQLVLNAGQDRRIDANLALIPYLETLTEAYVRGLAWIPDGSALAYVRRTDVTEVVLHRITDGYQQVLLHDVAPGLDVVWQPDHSKALLLTPGYESWQEAALWAPGEEPRPLTESLLLPTWCASGDQLAHIQLTPNPDISPYKGILPAMLSSLVVGPLEVGGTDLVLDLDEIEVAPVLELSCAPDGEYIAMAGAGGLVLMHLEPSKAGEIVARLKPALTTQWSPDGRFVAFTRSGQTTSLWVADRSGAYEVEVAGEIDGFFDWTSTGYLVYTTYRSDEGGTALWSASHLTHERNLLADAARLEGRVLDLDVSPDDKRIALVQRNGVLRVLVLGE